MSTLSSTSEQRNAEIWSTRLQRELLALTAQGEDTQEVTAVLPPFLTVSDHTLDIAEGVAKVYFRVDVEMTPTTTEQQQQQQQKQQEQEEPIVVLLDASLDHKPDGSVDTSHTAYPFVKPKVVLFSGDAWFPKGSTVQNGDELALDCDWTPSLHLTDAVLNVGLLIKESILQGEPYHKKPQPDVDPVEDLVKGARRFGTFLAKGARGLVPSSSAPLSSEPASQSKQAAATPKKKKKKRATSTTDITIGDEISLLESPWTECRGVYSCKAIRRPGFVADAMVIAESQGNSEQVAGAGFAGAGAMFRSFRQSAKSLVEESFLMITDTHIIELRSSKLNLSTGIVTFAIAVDMLAKLKFRRQESISLFFKLAPDDPLIYMCPDSADAVRQIQTVLQSRGVKGKHTNAATQRAIHEALQIVQEIQAKERALEYQPSTERVNEIMDLYRQAAERFEVAGDARHEEVVTHMRKFLALPLVVSILDGSYVASTKTETDGTANTKSSSGEVPQGEVLERTQEQLESDDHSVGPSNAEDDDKAFTENMDSILKEAKEDLDNLNVDNDKDLDELLDESQADEAIADLDAMLTAADKELANIMNS